MDFEKVKTDYNAIELKTMNTNDLTIQLKSIGDISDFR